MKRTLFRSLIFVLAVAGTMLLAYAVPSPEPAGDAKAQIQSARKALNAAKKTLGEEYNCCMEPGCDFCALAIDKCPCAANLTSGKAICGNCADGWEAGRGDVKNVDKSKIKRFSAEQAKAMFDKRVKGDK